VEHHFEMEFNSFANGKHTQGIIDLLYFDEVENGWVIVDFKSNNIQNTKDLVEFAKEKEYNKQLQTYKQLCQDKDMEVVQTILLFLDSGDEVEIADK
jgi:ATP-dependent exoDNAse (exonuclease V) beta subunit